MPQTDRQQDDGIEDEADVGPAEDGEQGEKHQADNQRNSGERPGHAPVAGELFLDRFDTQPEPSQLAPPLIFAQSPARFQVAFVSRGRAVRFHDSQRCSDGRSSIEDDCGAGRGNCGRNERHLNSILAAGPTIVNARDAAVPEWADVISVAGVAPSTASAQC